MILPLDLCRAHYCPFELSRRISAFVAVALVLLSVAPARSAVATAKSLIDQFGMEKIPVEGCWFKVTYSSTDQLPAAGLPARYGAPRIAGSAIYALVTREDFSAMHRLKTDEIWHFYAGDPIELLLLYPDGRSKVLSLGSDFLAGQLPQLVVPAGVWMGARPVATSEKAYGFFGTTMAPGFDPADFEPGYRDELQRAYPAQRELIGELTRAELATRPTVHGATPAVTAPFPAVFAAESVEMITVAPGVELRELTGRVARARTNDYSIARFTLAPGHGTGTSYNNVGEEVFLIISGHGNVVVDTETSPVKAGSVVVLKPKMRHSLTAADDTPLEFDAITVPAFSPDDYVRLHDDGR